MENEIITDDFSFKKVWDLLKASFKRILVFCVIAAIIMGIASAVVLITAKKTVRQISATYTYTHKGADDGLAPDGAELNINRVRSAQIVSLAIEKLNAEGKNIDLNNLNNIRQSLELVGHIPQNLLRDAEINITQVDRTYLQVIDNFFPVQYTLKFDISNLNISSSDAVELLNEILAQYIADFKLTYGAPALLDSVDLPVVDNTVNSYDYIELYSIYDENIRVTMSYLNTHTNLNPSFRSKDTGKTFKDISNSLNILSQTRLLQLETFILQNGLTDDINYTVEYLLLQRKQNSELQNRASQNADSVLKAIGEYSNGQIVMYVDAEGKLVTADGGPTATYNNMFNAYNAHMSSALEYGMNVALIENRLNYYADKVGDTWIPKNNPNNTSTSKADAQSMSAALVSQINELLTLANETATEYYETEYMRGAVSITLPAHLYTITTTLLKEMLIISVAIVFIAFVSAIITTHIVRKRNENPQVVKAETATKAE